MKHWWANFKESKIVIKTFVDTAHARQYNLIVIDSLWILNYNDQGPVPFREFDSSFKLENLIEISAPG